MLSMSDTKVEDVLGFFNNFGVDVAFLVPTPTGHEKSIMDAVKPLRAFLADHNIHDYTCQLQGEDNKVYFPAYFVYADRVKETEASLYRPPTKKGDPRIWFSGLKRYCAPKNLLAIATDKKSIFVFNLSSAELIKSLQEGGFASQTLKSISTAENAVAYELLSKLKLVHAKGFIKTITRGDTGIGMTLERELGIQANARKTPDYNGIEVKASRRKKGPQNRVNLFSQVPDWTSSRLKSGIDLLNEFGYVRNNRLQLYCTVKAHTPNSQGLYFNVDENKDLLFNEAKKQLGTVDVVQWGIGLLRDRLKEKHPETFWVKAKSRICAGVEEFLYEDVVHTRSPNSYALAHLIETQVITMDYTLSDENGRARDHGYLFKIPPEKIGLLFPPPQKYSLSD